MEVLVRDNDPAYIRVGRNAVEDVYGSVPGKLPDGQGPHRAGGHGRDPHRLRGAGVRPALDAALLLEGKGISARVIDMYCGQALAKEVVRKAARETKAIVTAEEHSIYGGMGSMVSQVVGESHPIPVKNLALPDEPAIAGENRRRCSPTTVWTPRASPRPRRSCFHEDDFSHRPEHLRHQGIAL